MKEQTDEKFELALWRYGIISPLLHRDANGLPFGEILDQASWQRYVHPKGSHVTLSAETLRKWKRSLIVLRQKRLFIWNCNMFFQVMICSGQDGL